MKVKNTSQEPIRNAKNIKTSPTASEMIQGGGQAEEQNDRDSLIKYLKGALQDYQKNKMNALSNSSIEVKNHLYYSYNKKGFKKMIQNDQSNKSQVKLPTLDSHLNNNNNVTTAENTQANTTIQNQKNNPSTFQTIKHQTTMNSQFSQQQQQQVQQNPQMYNSAPPNNSPPASYFQKSEQYQQQLQKFDGQQLREKHYQNKSQKERVNKLILNKDIRLLSPKVKILEDSLPPNYDQSLLKSRFKYSRMNKAKKHGALSRTQKNDLDRTQINNTSNDSRYSQKGNKTLISHIKPSDSPVLVKAYQNTETSNQTLTLVDPNKSFYEKVERYKQYVLPYLHHQSSTSLFNQNSSPRQSLKKDHKLDKMMSKYLPSSYQKKQNMTSNLDLTKSQNILTQSQNNLIKKNSFQTPFMIIEKQRQLTKLNQWQRQVQIELSKSQEGSLQSIPKSPQPKARVSQGINKSYDNIGRPSCFKMDPVYMNSNHNFTKLNMPVNLSPINYSKHIDDFVITENDEFRNDMESFKILQRQFDLQNRFHDFNKLSVTGSTTNLLNITNLTPRRKLLVFKNRPTHRQKQPSPLKQIVQSGQGNHRRHRSTIKFPSTIINLAEVNQRKSMMEVFNRQENIDQGFGQGISNEYNLNETLANFGNNGSFILQDLKPRYANPLKQQEQEDPNKSISVDGWNE
ncbi:UNKNOWN [Stylonychia lemnae]|uniref:Uncharacterized protein n=1 Tax=Stylonychia lemnae TaxID=5949 RepID=A0A078A6Q5_STYLE|nr:UNKNOWN [Stylonychia lemnae]|eukprot:CDW77267.1 UNKNOWN [Stylonychia lemnae]